MRRIATSHGVRHLVLYIQWLLLLGGVPLPSSAQDLPLQMAMRVAPPMEAAPRDMPAVDCQTFAFCCLAPPVPVRAFGTPERPEPTYVALAWRRDVADGAIPSASRVTSAPTVALRVLHCCWRN